MRIHMSGGQSLIVLLISLVVLPQSIQHNTLAYWYRLLYSRRTENCARGFDAVIAARPTVGSTVCSGDGFKAWSSKSGEGTQTTRAVCEQILILSSMSWFEKLT